VSLLPVPRSVVRFLRRHRRVPLCAAGVWLGACGVIGGADDYVIQVDSVAVAPLATSTGAVRTTYYGYVGANACAELQRVERQAFPGDTLQLRFIGRNAGGNCIQTPTALRYVDSLPNLPARTVHVRVLQRSGIPLHTDVTLPRATLP